MEKTTICSLSEGQKYHLADFIYAYYYMSNSIMDHVYFLDLFAKSQDAIFYIKSSTKIAQFENISLDFVILQKNLKILEVFNSSYPMIILSFNSSLKTLKLEFVILKDTVFMQHLKLDNLYLYNVEFPAESFYKVPQLEQLHLENIENCVFTIPDNSVTEYLVVSSVKISYLGYQPYLIKIQVSNCEIDTTLMTTYFPQYCQYVDVSEQNLQYIDLYCLPQLRYLNVSYNKELYLNNGFIPRGIKIFICKGEYANLVSIIIQHQDLEILDCAFNWKIRLISAANLRYLDAYSCRLYSLDLSQMRLLEYVNISDNYGLELTDNYFPPTVYQLVCREDSLYCAYIDYLASLELFDCSYNTEMRFYRNYFPESLKQLYMQNCELLCIDLQRCKLDVLDVRGSVFYEAANISGCQYVLTDFSIITGYQAEKSLLHCQLVLVILLSFLSQR